MFLNVVYAFLAEQCDASDRVAEPVFLAAKVKSEDVAAMSHRAALDDWLAAPYGQEAVEEQALISYLTG